MPKDQITVTGLHQSMCKDYPPHTELVVSCGGQQLVAHVMRTPEAGWGIYFETPARGFSVTYPTYEAAVLAALQDCVEILHRDEWEDRDTAA